MQASYIIVGSDGEKYGPHALDLVQGWINEGRIGKDTMVLKDGDSVWKKAEDFGDFIFPRPEPQAAMPAGMALAGAGAVAAPIGGMGGGAFQGSSAHTDGRYQALSELAPKVKSGASWFYWIAALTGVNAGAAMMGSDWRFILGIGLCEIFTMVGGALGTIGFAVTAVLNLLLIGSFVLFGIQANKAKVWPFVLGMLIFGGDTLIFLLAQEWISVAFHIWAVFGMFMGMKAAREAQAIAKGEAV